jgi:hypothetical protein
MVGTVPQLKLIALIDSSHVVVSMIVSNFLSNLTCRRLGRDIVLLFHLTSMNVMSESMGYSHHY